MAEGLAPPPFRPEEILAALERHEVEYVLIGGLAATLHGSPYPTGDVDVTPARNRRNLDRLAVALRELDARLRVVGLKEPIDVHLDDHALDQGTTWTFATRFGDLDICLLPDGTGGYPDLVRAATREPLTDTLTVSVSALADVIRSKEATGRDKDLRVLPALREVLARSGSS